MMQEFTSLGSLLALPVKLSNGIADRKQQSNLHTQRGFWASKWAAREVLYGEQNLNSSQ